MWHINNGEKNYGPFAEKKMRELIAQGKLPPTVYVWLEGTADWVLLKDSLLMQPAVPPVAAEPVNPFAFINSGSTTRTPSASVAPQAAVNPSPQQLQNPYWSDYTGQPTTPQAAAPSPEYQFSPLQGRKTAVLIAAAIAIVLTLVCVWSSFDQASLIQKFAKGDYKNNVNRAIADANASDKRHLIIVLTQLGALAIFSILFLMWFYRAHRNATNMSRAKLTDTSGWAVGFFSSQS
jgi:hypothetical protein